MDVWERGGEIPLRHPTRRKRRRVSEATINYLVDQKLKELADGLKKFTEGAEKKRGRDSEVLRFKIVDTGKDGR